MKAPPTSLETACLIQALERHWCLAVRQLEYLPLGFGSHHWRVSTTDGCDLFLAMHDLDLTGRFGTNRTARLGLLRQALSTARWLAAVAELEFVVGPLPDRSGRLVRQLADRFALSVYPWLDVEPFSDPDGIQTAGIIARLHAVTSQLPRNLVTTEDFVIPHRGALEDALNSLHIAWTSGPYAEPARAQLLQHADEVRSLMALYDRLARQAATSSSDWVLTHGEPSGPNLLRAADGRLHLVDWDTALLAPRERDFWDLRSTGAALTTYASVTHIRIDNQRMRLYEAWYALAEIAVYLAVFRAAHVGDANDATSWQNLLVFLPTPERWPELDTFSH